LEGLIKSGALDIFGERNLLLENVERLTALVKEMEESRNSKQADLFSLGGGSVKSVPKLNLKEENPASKTQILSWEKEFLGLYVSEHPFRYFEKKLSSIISPMVSLKNTHGSESTVRVGGIISTMKKIMTKKGDPMLFVMLEDGLTNMEILVFPRIYKENEAIWAEEKIVVAEGTLSDKDGEVKILCNKIWCVDENNIDETVRKIAGTPFFEDKRKKFAMIRKEKIESGAITPKQPMSKVMINYPTGATKELAERVKILFMGIPGNNQVFLKIGDKLIKTDFCISLDEKAKMGISSLLGNGSLEN